MTENKNKLQIIDSLMNDIGKLVTGKQEFSTVGSLLENKIERDPNFEFQATLLFCHHSPGGNSRYRQELENNKSGGIRWNTFGKLESSFVIPSSKKLLTSTQKR